jgi:lysozyme
MQRVPLGAVTVPGYDVSHYQSTNIHATMKSAGKKFAIIKAIQGEAINDALYYAHWKAALAAGMIVGAYNFFDPAQSIDIQAKHFLSVVGKLGPGTLGPICDFEQLDGTSALKSGQEVHDYMVELTGLVGRPNDGGIYGSPSFLQASGLPADCAQKFWLWIAEYQANMAEGPQIPPPYKVATMWQFTDGGSSNLDLNLFNGSLAQLQKLAGL